jgi:hypothetical protein
MLVAPPIPVSAPSLGMQCCQDCRTPFLRCGYVGSGAGPRPSHPRVDLRCRSRRCPFAGRPPEQDDDAMAELARAAQGRADLLAEHAGMCLGFAAANLMAQYAAKHLAIASLCMAAGGDMD